MKKTAVLLFMLAMASVAFSQNAYTQCIQECMKSGISQAACVAEGCLGIDTTVKDVITGQGNPLYLFSYELKGPAPVVDGSLCSRDGQP